MTAPLKIRVIGAAFLTSVILVGLFYFFSVDRDNVFFITLPLLLFKYREGGG